MAAPRLLKAVSLDVTGTLLRYRGHIGDIYGQAPRRYGYAAVSDEEIHQAFKKAYRECSEQFPCFGHGVNMDSKEWWRICVKKTFEAAGHQHPPHVMDKIFRYIYSSFGSARAYELFQDSQGFVSWLRGQGLATGVLSNATDRYGDSVLPMLGLHEDLDFVVLSQEVGVEKPDPRIFRLAMAQAGVQRPQEMLHIGDSYTKDYLPAVKLGMHAVLLDRFHTQEAEEWRRASVPVFPDLDSVRAWLISKGLVQGGGPAASATSSREQPQGRRVESRSP